MQELKDAKAAARQAAFAARKVAHEQGLDRAANGHLRLCLADLPGQVVAAYLPIRTEISPLEVMAGLVAAGRDVCVPVIEGPAMPLKFSRWTPGAALVAGPFRVMVPEVADWLQPDIVITPMLAFDRRGYRLGYGGGYYDRSLAALKAAKPVSAIGFAYCAQEVPEVPVEATDHPLDMLVTETGVMRF
ncbi:MAG: 5-formyltetrahydrofolate cyclo-ligase [Rhodobacteraceae bacterium]|nr:5-formyltetrahydrofolate cyclo-ligase [Paracoccaceae bacterium]